MLLREYKLRKGSRGKSFIRGLSFRYAFFEVDDFKPRENIEDDFDYSKLFGFSACWLPRIRKYDKKYTTNILSCLFKIFNLSFIIPHHWESYRFGSNIMLNRRYFIAYIYQNGERNTYMLASKPYDLNIMLDLKIKDKEVCFDIDFNTEKKFNITKKAYLLGYYHGGTIPSYMNYSFYIEKL